MATHKRSVSDKVKAEVLWRDSATCRLCNETLLDFRWQCDHIVPLWDGGSNVLDNLQAICANCHSEKTILEAQLRARRRREAAEAAAAAERAERAKQYEGLDLEQFRYQPDAST